MPDEKFWQGSEWNDAVELYGTDLGFIFGRDYFAQHARPIATASAHFRRAAPERLIEIYEKLPVGRKLLGLAAREVT